MLRNSKPYPCSKPGDFNAKARSPKGAKGRNSAFSFHASVFFFASSRPCGFVLNASCIRLSPTQSNPIRPRARFFMKWPKGCGKANVGFPDSAQKLSCDRRPIFSQNSFAFRAGCGSLAILLDEFRPEGNGLEFAPVWGRAAIITLNAIPCSAGWSVSALRPGLLTKGKL